jgi:hypothetical protein
MKERKCSNKMNENDHLQRVSMAAFRLVSLYSLYMLCVPDLELYLIHIPKFFTYLLFFSEIYKINDII